MATKTSELAREVESLRDRMDRIEGHLASSSAEGTDPVPLLREHFAPALAVIGDVIGAAVEGSVNGWRVVTYLRGFDPQPEEAVYDAEFSMMPILGRFPLHFLLQPHATPERFEADAADMTVIYRRK